jgi:hypothetical protein
MNMAHLRQGKSVCGFLMWKHVDDWLLEKSRVPALYSSGYWRHTIDCRM